MRDVWKQTRSHMIFSLFLCVSAPLRLISSRLLRLGTIPTSPRTQVGRQIDSVTGAAHTYLAGRGSQDLTNGSSWLVTGMVQQRRLIGGANRNFPHPFWHFGEKSLLQINGLLGLLSDFGRFWGYQTLPNFTIFDQKWVANGLEQADKGQSTGGLS